MARICTNLHEWGELFVKIHEFSRIIRPIRAIRAIRGVSLSRSIGVPQKGLR
jgi:hypothetical protein